MSWSLRVLTRTESKTRSSELVRMGRTNEVKVKLWHACRDALKNLGGPIGRLGFARVIFCARGTKVQPETELRVESICKDATIGKKNP